ncbi:MAG: cytochrome c [Acidobacteria bacterium]|nr:cytochrome c [Acidobacteriota bacterium]
MKTISKAGLMARVLLAVLWCSFFSAQAPAQGRSAGAQASTPAGNAENGKKLYNSIGCWQCHGYSGQGGAGAKIAPDPIPFAGFLRYNRKPSGAMPPYTAKVVSDAQLADIYAFLKTIPKPPDPKTIPLLNSD